MGKRANGRTRRAISTMVLVLVATAASTNVASSPASAANHDVTAIAGVAPPGPDVPALPSSSPQPADQISMSVYGATLFVHVGDVLYARDSSGIVRIDMTSGLARRVAGGGDPPAVDPPQAIGQSALTAQIGWSNSLAADAAGNTYFTALDSQNPSVPNQYSYVYKANGTTGSLEVAAGNGTPGYGGDGGPATAATVDPRRVWADRNGGLWFEQVGAQGRPVALRRIVNGTVTTVAGNGTDNDGSSFVPLGVAATSVQLPSQIIGVDATGNAYFDDEFWDGTASQTRLLRLDPNGQYSLVAAGYDQVCYFPTSNFSTYQWLRAGHLERLAVDGNGVPQQCTIDLSNGSSATAAVTGEMADVLLQRPVANNGYTVNLTGGFDSLDDGSVAFGGAEYPEPPTGPGTHRIFRWSPASTAVTYPLVVRLGSGGGGGTYNFAPGGLPCTTSPCTASFAAGTVVTITAAPLPGSVFDGWSGACTGTGVCTVTMDAAKTVTATFSKPSLTVTLAGAGIGSVSSNPSGITCGITCTSLFDIGSTVTLAPVAAAGSNFAGWTGACTGLGRCTVTMNASKAVTATFTRPRLTVTFAGTGSGSVSSNPTGLACTATCTAAFNFSSNVTLAAIPQPGSTFGGWSGACTGVGACTVTMNIPQRDVTATFIAGIWTIPPGAPERNLHTATLLPNGQVLFAGGETPTTPTASADLYNPVTRTWAATGAMTQARIGHSATLLATGKVLVAGGGPAYLGTGTTSADLFDPTTGRWTATGAMTQARSRHTATLLPNGKVLVTGGGGTSSAASRTAELYDPATGRWTATPAMITPHAWMHTATLLATGKVLVAGGFNGALLTAAELYDPATGRWTATGAMSPQPIFTWMSGRFEYTATRLGNGKVLASGGGNPRADLYDPATGRWTPTGAPPTYADIDGPINAVSHSATLLPSGKVLVAGGFGIGDLSTTQIYDPATATWSAGSSMAKTHTQHTATLLPDGTVLVRGSAPGRTNGAEIYQP